MRLGITILARQRALFTKQARELRAMSGDDCEREAQAARAAVLDRKA
jgi:hypothetical protein